MVTVYTPAPDQLDFVQYKLLAYKIEHKVEKHDSPEIELEVDGVRLAYLSALDWIYKTGGNAT